MSAELAGALRERVTIEIRASNRDTAAGATGRYVYSGQAWASLMPLVPASLSQADALSAKPRWQVTMRKRESVDLGARLTWRGKYLAVRSVISDPREPAYLIATCEEAR
jgi:head-tail adaptor